MRKVKNFYAKSIGRIFKHHSVIWVMPFSLHFRQCFIFLGYVLKIHLIFLCLFLGYFESLLCVMGWLKNVSDRCFLTLLWTKYSKHIKLFQLPASQQEYDKLVGCELHSKRKYSPFLNLQDSMMNVFVCDDTIGLCPRIGLHYWMCKAYCNVNSLRIF